MECFEFETSEEAFDFRAKADKEDKEHLYSVPYGRSVVIKLTREELNHSVIRAARPNESKPWLCDLPEYISPITGKPVDGRAARREELKRSGCREVDPSEFRVEYKNKRFIEKHGIKQ